MAARPSPRRAETTSSRCCEDQRRGGWKSASSCGSLGASALNTTTGAGGSIGSTGAENDGDGAGTDRAKGRHAQSVQVGAHGVSCSGHPGHGSACASSPVFAAGCAMAGPTVTVQRASASITSRTAIGTRERNAGAERRPIRSEDGSARRPPQEIARLRATHSASALPPVDATVAARYLNERSNEEVRGIRL